jgi:hypothetical protein
MKRSPCKPHPGRELRGFRVRIYPSQEQELLLRDHEEKLKQCWNWLCARARDVSDAREAYAARYHGVVAPERPATEYPEGGTTPEQISAIWAAYRVATQAWRAEVRRVCKGVDAVTYRSIKDWMQHFGATQDYQIFGPALGLSKYPVGCGLLRALCKDYGAALAATKRGQAPPRFKRAGDHVTLRSREGLCFRLGAEGHRPGKRAGSHPGRGDWLNCAIKLPAIEWIPGRIGTEQMPRLEAAENWLEGVSVVEESDGWYAGIRQWVIPRALEHRTSPDSRWSGYGLPSTPQPNADHGRSPNWLRSEHRGWGVEVRDTWLGTTRYEHPDSAPQEERDHRWRVSLQRPDGRRMNPNKACPTRATAEEWARARVDSLIAHQTPGTRLALAPVRSPRASGGELVIGVDSGLANLLTLSGPCGSIQTGNSRALDLLETVAERQKAGERSERLLTQGARRTRHLLRGVLAWLEEARPDVVQIEDGGSSAQSIATFLATESRGRTRKTGGYVPAAGWLLARVRERFPVREVETAGVTEDCSHCGAAATIALNSATRKARCSSCGHTVDQDLGTARNVRRKRAKSQGSSGDGSQRQHGSA